MNSTWPQSGPQHGHAVNHEELDDNQFMLDNPVDSDHKNIFRQVVDNFCRSVS